MDTNNTNNTTFIKPVILYAFINFTELLIAYPTSKEAGAIIVIVWYVCHAVPSPPKKNDMIMASNQ
jgi:hypothetical protein